ncbi:hypothetical protein HDU99_001875 [Rhizoclosmatium hyalinum]|nr:hypothetical protein HDU99_001875 [Rhizoclosmatium hyalinum]
MSGSDAISILNLPIEIKEILLVYAGFSLASTCSELHRLSNTTPTHTRLLLTWHNILPLSPIQELPPVPVTPFQIGPNEERWAAFLSDKRTKEGDVISVLQLRYATPVFVELASEMAVSKRWFGLWRCLFPTPFKHSMDESCGLDLVREGVVLAGWGGTQDLDRLAGESNFKLSPEFHVAADSALVQSAMFDRTEMVQWLLYRGVYLRVPGTGEASSTVEKAENVYQSIANTITAIHDAENSSGTSSGAGNSWNLVTPEGMTTALILSAKHPGSLGTLSILLNHPLSDVNVCDGSPLAWSSRTGCLDAVKLLLTHGADATIRNGIAGLWAAEYGHTEIVKLYVSKGLMDIHAQEEYALRWSVARGHFETVSFLCKVGAVVDAMGGFALRHAVQMGHEEIVDVLLEYGADVAIASRAADEREGIDSNDRQLDEENSLVRWATRAGNTVLAKKLIDALRTSRLRSRICVMDVEE